MRSLSFETWKTLVKDPFMKECCYPHAHSCRGHIEWHHNCITAGRQCDIASTILPLCTSIHTQANNSEVREVLDYLMFSRMPKEDFDQINIKGTFSQRKKYIMEKYDKHKVTSA